MSVNDDGFPPTPGLAVVARQVAASLDRKPSKTNERVKFRLLRMQCCHVPLCWVNPRFPNYCPECGVRCFPNVRGWVTFTDENAWLKMDRMT